MRVRLSRTGNLERECGYRPILEAAKKLAQEKIEWPATFAIPKELTNYPVPALVVNDQFTTYYRPNSLAETFTLMVCAAHAIRLYACVLISMPHVSVLCYPMFLMSSLYSFPLTASAVCLRPASLPATRT